MTDLTEPATEAGREFMAKWGPRTVRESVLPGILAIEAEAVQREREALVERVAEALHKAAYPDRPCPDIGWHIDEARRLLGLDA